MVRLTIRPEEVIERCLAHAGAARRSPVHGEGHWMRVATVGRRLLGDVPDADAAVVLRFALLHDARRENDGHDPGHGPRAAALVREIGADPLGLSDGQLDLLATACHDHTRAPGSDDPTLAVCFDADRLTLWRVGITPDPAFLSTEPGRRAGTIAWSAELEGARLDWTDVVEGFAASSLGT